MFLGVLLLATGADPGEITPFLTLRESLTIGGAGDESKGIVFASIRDIDADEDGRIYVLDQRDCLVRVFDAQGRSVLSFGKKGQGPGDLQSPLSISSLSGHVISIFDFGNKKIARFDLKGASLEEIDLRRAGDLFRAEAEAKGAVFGVLLEIQAEGSMIQRLIRFAPPDRSSRVLAETQKPTTYPAMSLVPDPSYRMRALPDGRFVWIYEGEYALNIVSSEGTAELRRTREYRPVKVTGQDKERLIKEEFGGKEKMPPGRTLVWPKLYPPLSYLEIADNGWIIVRATARGSEGTDTYDVFDGTRCEFLGSFQHSGEERLYAVRSGMAYFSAESEEGFPLVKRYEVVIRK